MEILDASGLGHVSVMIHLRSATEDDAALLLAWRNDPITRAASRSTEPVEFAVHLQWLRSNLSSQAVKIFIAEHDGRPVGVVRAVHCGEYSELSWTVAPVDRGKGIGAEIVSRAVSVIGVRPLRAEIRSENNASIRIAEKCGFVLQRERDHFLFYQLV